MNFKRSIRNGIRNSMNIWRQSNSKIPKKNSVKKYCRSIKHENLLFKMQKIYKELYTDIFMKFSIKAKTSQFI